MMCHCSCTSASCWLPLWSSPAASPTTRRRRAPGLWSLSRTWFHRYAILCLQLFINFDNDGYVICDWSLIRSLVCRGVVRFFHMFVCMLHCSICCTDFQQSLSIVVSFCLSLFHRLVPKTGLNALMDGSIDIDRPINWFIDWLSILIWTQFSGSIFYGMLVFEHPIPECTLMPFDQILPPV